MDITVLQEFSCSISALHNFTAAPASIGASSPSVKILISAIILLALIALVILTAIALRKWFYKEDNQAHGGFLLSDLRQMHERGQLTDEELSATKNLIVKQSQAADDSQHKVSSKTGDGADSNSAQPDEDNGSKDQKPEPDDK